MICHAERSTEEREAILSAESKHPYLHLTSSMDTTPPPSPPNTDSCAESTPPSWSVVILQLLLTRECFVHVIVKFKVEQSNDLVAIRETLKFGGICVESPAVKVSPDPDIQRARQTSHDVYAVVFAVTGHEGPTVEAPIFRKFRIGRSDECHRLTIRMLTSSKLGDLSTGTVCFLRAGMLRLRMAFAGREGCSRSA